MHSPSTLTVLRERTAALHDELEHSDLVLPATRERARYRTLIGAMLAFHDGIEPEFRRHEASLTQRGIEMSGRYRTETLRRESTQISSPTLPPVELQFESAAHAAGGVYVMEGSRLGGLVIAKSVRRHLAHESAYYGAHGAQTAERWRATCAQLDAFAESAAEVEAMAAGANQTFTALHGHLAQVMREASVSE